MKRIDYGELNCVEKIDVSSGEKIAKYIAPDLETVSMYKGSKVLVVDSIYEPETLIEFENEGEAYVSSFFDGFSSDSSIILDDSKDVFVIYDEPAEIPDSDEIDFDRYGIDTENIVYIVKHS